MQWTDVWLACGAISTLKLTGLLSSYDMHAVCRREISTTVKVVLQVSFDSRSPLLIGTYCGQENEAVTCDIRHQRDPPLE